MTMSFFLIDTIAAAKAFPTMNASSAGGNLISKRYAHIGFTADMLDGPVTFLVGNATCKSLFDIACESSVLARKARDGRLALTEMQGRCITISRLGGNGRTGSLRSLMRLRTKEEWMKNRLKELLS